MKNSICMGCEYFSQHYIKKEGCYIKIPCGYCRNTDKIKLSKEHIGGFEYDSCEFFMALTKKEISPLKELNGISQQLLELIMALEDPKQIK